MKNTSNRDTLRQLLPTLSADDQAWLRQQLLGWKPQGRLHNTDHLHPQELLALESWFWERYGEARITREKLPRLRNWLIFMLLRHGGLRPHEIFALTPSDMDWASNCVNVRDTACARLVPLAPDIARRMQRACADAVFAEGKAFLHCDDGFMRRSLQQAAAACGLPGGVINARSLRRHRAQELLQQGIPLPVVDIFLGRTTNASNTIMRYNAKAALELLETHLQSDRPMKSSARNIFQGRVRVLERVGILVNVVLATASGLEVAARITDVSCQRLALAEGKLVNASVKAPWVEVERLDYMEKDASVNTSTWPENTFLAEVEQVRNDDSVVELLAKLEEGSQVCAIQSYSGKRDAPLQQGHMVRIHFSASSVILTV